MPTYCCYPLTWSRTLGAGLCCAEVEPGSQYCQLHRGGVLLSVARELQADGEDRRDGPAPGAVPLPWAADDWRPV